MRTLTPERRQGLRAVLRLQSISLGWMVAEAAVSLVSGASAHSLLLIAFGGDSVAEIISAGVLYWRLRNELTAPLSEPESADAVERVASRIAGYLLYLLILYTSAQALIGLILRNHAETSWPGIAVALAAAFGMPVLARAKIKVAEQIGSRALRADAMETFTCGWLAWALLSGLAANALVHWWWLDSAASLAIVPLLWREAREALSGECASEEAR